MKSYTKNGDIYLRPCTEELFPSNIHPIYWDSCSDAYEYTWLNDYNNFLINVSLFNKIKLAKSIGFCPHNRCQISNISNSDNGLCYTKLEYNYKSFGACIFTNNYSYNNGQLIGYYNKINNKMPKPIYKHSRVILNTTTSNSIDSFEAYIDANKVHSNIIVTQCPLLLYVNDVKQMIIEQNITLWIQLAPYLSDSIGDNRNNTCSSNDNSSYGDIYSSYYYPYKASNCMLFPNAYLHCINNNITYSTNSNSNSIPTMGSYYDITNITVTSPAAEGYHTNNFHLQYFDLVHSNNNNNNNNSSSYETESNSIYRVRHVWYHKWRDFHIPQQEDSKDMLLLVNQAANVIRNGGTIAISCSSGRGRSGTFATLVIARLLMMKRSSTNTDNSSNNSTNTDNKYKYNGSNNDNSGGSRLSHDELTDIIVSIRRNRDGGVETPRQYQYIANLLNITISSKYQINNTQIRLYPNNTSIATTITTVDSINNMLSYNYVIIISFIMGIIFSYIISYFIKLLRFIIHKNN